MFWACSFSVLIVPSSDEKPCSSGCIYSGETPHDHDGRHEETPPQPPDLHMAQAARRALRETTKEDADPVRLPLGQEMQEVAEQNKRETMQLPEPAALRHRMEMLQSQAVSSVDQSATVVFEGNQHSDIELVAQEEAANETSNTAELQTVTEGGGETGQRQERIKTPSDTPAEVAHDYRGGAPEREHSVQLHVSAVLQERMEIQEQLQEAKSVDLVTAVSEGSLHLDTAPEKDDLQDGAAKEDARAGSDAYAPQQIKSEKEASDEVENKFPSAKPAERTPAVGLEKVRPAQKARVGSDARAPQHITSENEARDGSDENVEKNFGGDRINFAAPAGYQSDCETSPALQEGDTVEWANPLDAPPDQRTSERKESDEVGLQRGEASDCKAELALPEWRGEMKEDELKEHGLMNERAHASAQPDQHEQMFPEVTLASDVVRAAEEVSSEEKAGGEGTPAEAADGHVYFSENLMLTPMTALKVLEARELSMRSELQADDDAHTSGSHASDKFLPETPRRDDAKQTEEHADLTSHEASRTRVGTQEEEHRRTRGDQEADQLPDRQRSSLSPTNTETWLNEVEFCTSSEDVVDCLIMYIERQLPIDSDAVQQRLAARMIARFCRARLQGFLFLQQVAAVSVLQVHVSGMLQSQGAADYQLDPRRLFQHKRHGISLIQSRIRKRSASSSWQALLAAVRRQQSFVRRHLSMLKIGPEVGVHMQRRLAAKHLSGALLRSKRSATFADFLKSVRILQRMLRRQSAQSQLGGMSAAVEHLRASLRRKLTCAMNLSPPQSSEEVVNDILSSILRNVSNEVALRRNPFETEHSGKIKARLRRGFLVSRGKVVESVKRQMADLGRTMSRYLGLSIPEALQRRPGDLFPAAESVKASSSSKSRDLHTSWCGGLAHEEVLARQRSKWPSKEKRARLHQESLDNFHARMRFMRDRREWERLHSTSRLDPLFRTGTGAPVMRQRSVDQEAFERISTVHSVETVESAPGAWQSQHRRLPWKQEEPKPPPPRFVSPSKSRRATAASTSSDFEERPVKTKLVRPAVLMHQVKYKAAALVWQGFESTQDIQDREAKKVEEQKRSLEDEARTLFNMIDKDGSGTLDEVTSPPSSTTP